MAVAARDRESGAGVARRWGVGVSVDAMAGTSARVEARRRAREARARRLEVLREHEKQVARLVGVFYEHDEFRRRHEYASAAAVAELLRLGESVEDVAALLGVDPGRVRTLKVLARNRTGDTGSGPLWPAVPGSG